MTLKTLGTLGSIAITAGLFSCGQKAEDKAVNAEAAALDKARSDAKAAEDLVKTKEAQETGIDAYVYAYPLVTMELTRRVLTNVRAAGRSEFADGTVRQAADLSTR